MRRLLCAVLALSVSTPLAAQTPTPTPRTAGENVTHAARPNPQAPVVSAEPGAADPYQWLEEFRSPRALEQVEAWNARTLAVLERDPRYQRFFDQTLAIVQATDRIPGPAFRGDRVDNFWRDETNTHGLWRRTTLDSYRTAQPHWETMLDLDALSRSEGKNWVWAGAACLPPAEDLCLVSLSDGGQDADVIREFDAQEHAFVEGGFNLSEGKQNAVWIDDGALLVGRDWGPGTMTASGYAFVLKRLRRGQPLSAAEELFRGQASDVSVFPSALRDPDGRLRALMAIRGVTFFESEFHLLGDDGPVRIPVPGRSSFQGFIDGQMIFSLEEAWTPRAGAESFPVGALVAIDLDAFVAAPAQVRAALVYAPTSREAVQSVSTTRNRLVVNMLENVRGAVYSFARENGRWTRTRLNLPENAAINVVSTRDSDDALFASVASFTQPDTLWLADAAGGPAQQIKSLPARFNAEGLVTEQFEATSRDGTRVPYFVVRRADIAYDGSNPTLISAYGGFQVSRTPAYSGPLGKLWLENGGVYVLANIRGGGEFGPAWHQAGLNVNRQRIYDDFAAVGEDLIRRRITSPRRLGISGGSNGGLLTGVQMTQRPDLWNAVVIRVPLLDMLGFERIGAGASWAGEYGSTSNPEQRAFLASISPYHALRADRRYPTPFLMTSTNDDRVSPAHARKMAARMEAMGLPFNYYEDTAGGHSGDANLRQVARETSLMYVYLARQLMD